jgi:hypothetical protein
MFRGGILSLLSANLIMKKKKKLLTRESKKTIVSWSLRFGEQSFYRTKKKTPFQAACTL